jgi:hypothetical protein
MLLGRNQVEELGSLSRSRERVRVRVEKLEPTS